MTRTKASAASAVDQSWAPLTLSPVQVPELGSEWLRGHLSEVLLLDVREPDEYRGELGHIAGAELVPLQALPGATSSLRKDRPVVTVCRSGGRSGKAALALVDCGFTRVASLAGGMTGWRQRQLAVEYGPPLLRALDRQG